MRRQPFVHGINSIPLVSDGRRRCIVSVAWDTERPDGPIPRSTCRAKGSKDGTVPRETARSPFDSGRRLGLGSSERILLRAAVEGAKEGCHG